MPTFRLLAAIDFDMIVGLLFAAVSIGVAIVNSINGKKEPPRKNGGGRPKDQRVRQEIDEFLQQQGGGRKARPVEVQLDEIELVEEPPRRRPSPVVKPTKTPRKQQQAASPPRPKTPQPVTPATRPSALPTQVTRRGETAVGSSDFGGGLREHVQTAMAERVAAQAQRDIPHLSTQVNEMVRSDLGVFSVSGKTDAVRSGSSSLIQMLQNPKTARQAVLMSEIMGRPRALRK